MAYNNSQEVLDKLREGSTNVDTITTQMYRYFIKKDIDKWLMFAKGKTLYLMEKGNDDKGRDKLEQPE